MAAGPGTAIIESHFEIAKWADAKIEQLGFEEEEVYADEEE